ncbi:hypothetical protein MIMGU_mgv1a026487mg, partial [Erythranthe guttata]
IVIREEGAPAAATTATTNAVYNLAPLNAGDGEVNQQQQQAFKRDANQYMSIANITRIMRRVLPANAKIANNAKEAIEECISEFIRFITAEANARCHRDYRNTVTPEDVLAAMATLGFDDYLEPLTIFLNKHRAQQNPERGSMNQLPQFVRRDRTIDGGSSGFVHHQQQQGAQMVQSPPPPTATPTVGYYVPLPPPPSATVEEEEKLGGLTKFINDYMLRNHGGGGQGSSRGCDFDPF